MHNKLVFAKRDDMLRLNSNQILFFAKYPNLPGLVITFIHVFIYTNRME